MRDGPAFRAPSPDYDLEAALHDLAAHIALPGSRGIAGVVRRRIDAASTPRAAAPPTWWKARRPLARSVALALVGTLLLAGVALAVGLGLRGLRIAFVDELPPVPSMPESADRGSALGIGVATSLDEARRAAGFPVVVPTAPGLGRPDEVYLIRREPSNVVSLVYEPLPDRPPAAPTDVGLLLMQFRGTMDEDYMKSLLESGVAMRRVEVDGELGFWIEGQHVLEYIGPDGRHHAEPARVVGDVLVWQRGSLLLRLETGGTMEDALRIAHSVR